MAVLFGLCRRFHYSAHSVNGTCFCLKAVSYVQKPFAWYLNINYEDFKPHSFLVQQMTKFTSRFSWLCFSGFDFMICSSIQCLLLSKSAKKLTGKTTVLVSKCFIVVCLCFAVFCGFHSRPLRIHYRAQYKALHEGVVLVASPSLPCARCILPM